MAKDKFEEISEFTEEQKRQSNEYMRTLEKRVNEKKGKKSAQFYAEGIFLIKETFEEIKKYIEDFRKNPPVALENEEQDDDGMNLQSEYGDINTNTVNTQEELSYKDGLELALHKLEQANSERGYYTEEETHSKQIANNRNEIESDSYKNTRAALNDAMELLDGCFRYKESDSDIRFRKLYATTANLIGMMDCIEKGNLCVPTPDTKTENGKKVHFVNNLKSKNFHEPFAGYWNTTLDNVIYPENFDISDAHYIDKTDEPLFTHDPRPEDLFQGGLGNCYMISMLSSIAAQDPQFIKDSIVDHGKTVTVRFYNSSKEPVYVTVDKKVPGIQDITTGNYLPVYSSGPLWVKMMEKAFAASGLINGALKEAEKGKYFGDHRDINRCSPDEFIKAFLGDNYVELDEENVKVPEPNNFRGRTVDEAYFIQSVNMAVNKGKVLYAGTRFRKDKQAIQREKTDISGKEFLGIYNNHAYSLVGIVNENNKTFVKVRNPHGYKGRVYDEQGKPSVNDDNKGYSLIDIKMFGHYFDVVQCFGTKTDLSARRRQSETADLNAMYGDTVKIIEKTLRQTDAFYMKAFDSPEFDRMRQSSLRLKEYLDYKKSHPYNIKAEFDTLFKAAHDYLNYRDNRVRPIKEDLSDRAANRYQIAELIVSLETLYKDNLQMKKADPRELANACNELGDNPSQAKRASVEVIERRVAEAAAIQNQKNKKTEVNNAPQNDNIILP